MLFAFCRRATLARALRAVLLSNSLFGSCVTLHAATGDPDELLGLCRTDSLPQDIRGSLSRNFSTWKIQEPTDLSPRARARWATERPLACPGIAAGHFQNAKDSSYAVLLIPASHGSDTFKLLIFTQQSGQQFYGFKAVGQADGASDVFVHAVPTVRFFESTSKWVSHSRVSEAVMFVDSAALQAAIYIWADESYQKEPVSYQ
jgi:hypothetical protein